MQPETIPVRAPLQHMVDRVPVVWRLPLVRLLLVWTGLIALFWPDWSDMAGQWWNSSTYNHVLLVPAILVWIVTLRMPQLARISPSCWWMGLLPFAAALLLWLAGSFSGLNLARQAGAVIMLQGAFLALMGPRVSIGLLFPLGYMLFLIPFGGELIPLLQTITAEITTTLTHWSGIPAQIDGVFIDTPVGLFEVAEACSGVEFLIAMVALGALVAHICFRGWQRRLAFMMLCFVLPIVGNGIRAWGTIYIAQFRGVEFAAGFDHIFYGWIFFALIMALALALAWRFFDRAIDDPFIDGGKLAAMPLPRWVVGQNAPAMAVSAMMAAMLVITVVWAAMAARLEAPMPESVALPEVQGWTRVDYSPSVWWQPRASGSAHHLLGSYRSARGQTVDVFFALYPDQNEGHEAGGFGQGALMPNSVWSWLGNSPVAQGGAGERLLAGQQGRGNVERLAATWYRNGAMLSGSNARLKLENMANRFQLQDDATMMLIVSAEERSGQPASAAINSFLSSAGPIGEWMDRVADLP